MPKKVPPPRTIAQVDYEHWTLSEDTLNKILTECDFVLPRVTRYQIRSCLWSHMCAATDKMAASEAAPVFDLADSIIRQCKELLGELVRVDTNEDAYAAVLRRALKRAKFGAIPLGSATTVLIQLRDSCEQAREDLGKQVFGGDKSGPNKPPELEELIWHMSFILQQCGYKPTANYSSEAKMPSGRRGGRNTPFVRFVYALMQHLPPDLRVEFGALGEFINRALKAKPEGWSPK